MNPIKLQLRFTKAGKVWWVGARDKREPHVTIEQIVSKSETTKNLHAFQDLNGISIYLKAVLKESFKTQG